MPDGQRELNVTDIPRHRHFAVETLLLSSSRQRARRTTQRSALRR
jgi:hypothetical protein